MVLCSFWPGTPPSLARVYMLSASLHIDCACALTGAVHFLDTLSRSRDIYAWAGMFNTDSNSLARGMERHDADVLVNRVV